ncbi:MAG: hypothetical protein QMC28_00835, partial [Flavobacteriales bacterium]
LYTDPECVTSASLSAIDDPTLDTLEKVILEDSNLVVCPPESSSADSVVSLSLDCGPSHGTTLLDSSTGCVSYTPAINYIGNDIICIVICDTAGVCDTTVVLVTVSPVTDTISIVTSEDSALVICPPATSRVDNIGSISMACGPNNGTSIIDTAIGCVTYISDTNYVGADTLCIVICNTADVCDTTVVLVVVLDTIVPVAIC